MSLALRRVLPRWSPRLGQALLALLAGTLAMAFAVGTTPDGFAGLLVAGVLLAVGLAYAAVVAPGVLMAVLLAEVIAFPVLPILQGRGLNPEDVLMPVLLVATWIFTRDRAAWGARPVEVEARRRGILRGVGAYYGLALLTLALLALRGQPQNALDSFMSLVRSVEGALFFYLVSRHAHDRRGLLSARNAVLGGLFVVFAINLFAVLAGGVPRAGSSIIFGTPSEASAASWAIGSAPFVMTNPNELGAACVLVWAILIGIRPRGWVFVCGLAASFILLLMSQSRSGILSWVVFLFLLGLRRGRRRLLLLPLLAVGLVPLLPGGLRDRIVRTVVLERGSFEAYSSLIRVYCWQTSWKVFLAHPFLGVGYLGFRYVSPLYNTLGVQLWTAEEFFLETAAGMGFLGPLIVGAIGIAIVRLGSLCRKVGEPGSIAHSMGTVTFPFVISVAAGNLTGDNLIGLLGVSQVALFVALLAQAARNPECQRAAGKAA